MNRLDFLCRTAGTLGVSFGVGFAAAALATACGFAPGFVLRADDGAALAVVHDCPAAIDSGAEELGKHATALALALDAHRPDVVTVMGDVDVFCMSRHDQRVHCANAFRHGADPDPEECLTPDGGGLRVAPGVVPGIIVSAEAVDPVGLMLHGMTHHVLEAMTGDVDEAHRSPVWQ